MFGFITSPLALVGLPQRNMRIFVYTYTYGVTTSFSCLGHGQVYRNADMLYVTCVSVFSIKHTGSELQGSIATSSLVRVALVTSVIIIVVVDILNTSSKSRSSLPLSLPAARAEESLVGGRGVVAEQLARSQGYCCRHMGARRARRQQ